MLSRPISQAWGQANPAESPSDRLVRNEEGFSLDMAGGFELGRQQDGYYMLGSRTIPGLILVRAMPGLSAAELNRTLRSGYSDPTVQLTPEGPITELEFQGGFGKLAEVRGFLIEDEVQGLLAGYLRPSGGGLLLFAVTSSDQWPELNPIAEQIARSVRVFVTDPEELIRLWTERLAGFKLIQANHTDGAPGREEKHGQSGSRVYHLCSDGTFLYDEDASAPSTGEETVPANQIAGGWKIVPDRLRTGLILTFEDGRNHSYRLSRHDQETYLDDQRYFVLPNEQCR